MTCRLCWQCRSARKNDFVGRVIAESKDAVGTTFITLTYGNASEQAPQPTSDIRSQVLTYSDVQKWLKRIRADNYPVRYFCVGEYGTEKGRVHWHVIAFWQRKVPNYMEGVRNFTDKYWSPFSNGGHSYWEEFRIDNAYYACKYVLKDDKEGRQSEWHASLKPALGFRFFHRLARKYVEQGIVPQDGTYRFPEVTYQKGPDAGKIREFCMQGVSIDYFCEDFIRMWGERYGEHPLDRQYSEFIMQYEDRRAARLVTDGLEQAKRVAFPEVVPPHLPWPIYEDGHPVSLRHLIYLDERRNCYACEWAGKVLYWSFDEDGYPAWVADIVTARKAERMRAEFVRQRESVEYRKASGR